ncbi:MAG: ATP-binding protein [Alphaproteobacteria bacterium]
MSTFAPRNRVLQRLAVWFRRRSVARRLALALTIAALLSGVATYAALTGSPPFGPNPRTLVGLIVLDVVLLLPLAILVAIRIVRLWVARRKGAAGAKLHTRLVLLLSVLATTPAIVVAVFSALFFNFGIQAWFSDRVRVALSESLAVTDAYLNEHQTAIRADVLAAATEINRQAIILSQSQDAFQRFFEEQMRQLGFNEAIVVQSDKRVIASVGLSFALQLEPIPEWAVERVRRGEVAIMTAPGEDRVRALMQLDQYVNTFLFVARAIDPTVTQYIKRAQEAVAEYQRLEGQRSSLQVSFYILFAIVSLLLLLAAIWAGLVFANQLVRPISQLIGAAERVRTGDLKVRVSETDSDDEMGSLSRSFNRMTSQLERNRRELVEANRQLDARREFIETVMEGVSAGVIGLDAKGRINLTNRSASELLSITFDTVVDKSIHNAVPEMVDLFDAARRRPDRVQQAEIQVRRNAAVRTLLVRIGAESIKSEVVGYVVTFDDVTELVSAQRKAAWADVARRIAHEIKNPLTPIQLSAERLRRRYLHEITSDREVFEACTNTIVRQVGDIGRLVDEFSSFARMPAPVMRAEDLRDICRQALILQQGAHGQIGFDIISPQEPVMLACDRHQIGRALTNLLQNAIDSLSERPAQPPPPRGQIKVTVSVDDDGPIIEVIDNGPGYPTAELHRLTEPYVTTRAKGTGLGLAIVRKIMEDHGGHLILDNGPSGGARARLVFRAAAGAVRMNEAAAE